MELYDRISNITKGEKVKIGLIIVNKNNEVLLLKENLERINKTIHNIPTIEIEDLEEDKIIKGFNEKYGFKIDKLYGYVNGTNILDEKCNKILQINLYTKIDNNYDLKDNITKELELIEVDECVPENIKNTIQIFKYNEKAK